MCFCNFVWDFDLDLGDEVMKNGMDSSILDFHSLVLCRKRLLDRWDKGTVK